jgi:hypothetical protein
MVERHISVILLIRRECSKKANAKRSGQRRIYCLSPAGSFQNSIDVVISEICFRGSPRCHRRQSLQNQRKRNSEALPHPSQWPHSLRSMALKQSYKVLRKDLLPLSFWQPQTQFDLQVPKEHKSQKLCFLRRSEQSLDLSPPA